MSRNNNAQITYCEFPLSVSTTKYYTCYKKEVCCSQGCCINAPYPLYQVWYYWLIILILFGIISGGSWLCKKPQVVPCTVVSSYGSSRNSYCSHTSCNRRRCTGYFSNRETRDCNTCENNPSTTTDFDENIILDRLYVSFRNRNALGDPPSYTSILSSNYNNKPNICRLYSYYGPPPTYSSMFKTPSAVIDENIPTGSSTGVIRIQVHAEANGNKPISDGNTETVPVTNQSVESSCDSTNNDGLNASTNLENVNEREQSTVEIVDADTQLPGPTPENNM